MAETETAVAERRAHILAAAKEVFAEGGFKQSTVREIGARAGVLSGSLYYYFPSKLDIVDAILRDFCGVVLAEYHAIVAAHDDAMERIDAMARYAISLIDTHAAAVLVLQNDSADLVGDARFDYLVQFNEDVEQHWVDAIAEGIAQGRIRSGIDPSLHYRFARDAILGATAWYDPSSRRTLADIADAFTAMLVHGVTAPSAGR